MSLASVGDTEKKLKLLARSSGIDAPHWMTKGQSARTNNKEAPARSADVTCALLLD